MSDTAPPTDPDPASIEEHLKGLARRVDRHRAVEGERPDLAAIDTRGTPAWDGDKEEGKAAALL